MISAAAVDYLTFARVLAGNISCEFILILTKYDKIVLNVLYLTIINLVNIQICFSEASMSMNDW